MLQLPPSVSHMTTTTQAETLPPPVPGTAAGLARYLGADVTIIRIILVVLAFVGGAGVPIYLAGWLLIPEEGSDQSIAGSFFQSRQTRSL